MSDWTSLKSSHVEAARYDDAAGELQIRFKGGLEYGYQAPKEVFDGLVASPSPGNFIHRHVRPHYTGNPLKERTNGRGSGADSAGPDTAA